MRGRSWFQLEKELFCSATPHGILYNALIRIPTDVDAADVAAVGCALSLLVIFGKMWSFSRINDFYPMYRLEVCKSDLSCPFKSLTNALPFSSTPSTSVCYHRLAKLFIMNSKTAKHCYLMPSNLSHEAESSSTRMYMYINSATGSQQRFTFHCYVS